MDNIIHYLINYASTHNIMYQVDSMLPSYAPAVSYPSMRFIIINANWYNKNELPFIFAHELGHIMLGHCKYPCQSPTWTIKQEHEADVFATSLLWDYARNTEFTERTFQQFLSSFSIPTRVWYDALRQTKKPHSCE